MASTKSKDSQNYLFHLRSHIRRGFTLVEMLVVIAVMSLLMTAAGPVFDSLTNSQSPGAVASTLAGQFERARQYAISKNTFVWMRLGAVAEEPNVFFIGVYESLDGTSNAANARGVWTAPCFMNFKLSNSLDSSLVRPAVSAANQPADAAWVRFTPVGEAWVIPGVATESRIKLVPPTTTGTLVRWTEFGIQPTRRGQVPDSMKRDVASVQLSGLTGQTLTFSR